MLLLLVPVLCTKPIFNDTAFNGNYEDFLYQRLNNRLITFIFQTYTSALKPNLYKFDEVIMFRTCSR